MFGYILYETIEMVYYISKMTYNGVKNTYNWYYNIDTQQYNNTIQMIEMKETLILLNNNINKMQEKIEFQNKIITEYVENNKLINNNNHLRLTYEN